MWTWLAAALVAAAPIHAQELAPSAPRGDAPPATGMVDSADRVRAALARPPSKLTLQERTPDFSVHIEKRRPMQEIFETPVWQLPPHGWQPPAVGFNLMSIVSYVAQGISDAKRGHDLRVARDEVQRSIAEYCAAQENRADIQICSTSPAIR